MWRVKRLRLRGGGNRLSSYSKSFAFTLAEVLFTLGIIGVVASLTMPSLIQNHDKQIIETRLQNFYSKINQALLMSEQDKNMMRTDWRPSALCASGTHNSYSCNLKVFNEYFKDYIKYTKLENKQDILYVYFTDGSAAYFTYFGQDITFFPKASKAELSNPKSGKDKFMFAFYPAGASGNRNLYFKNLGVEPYIHSDWDGTKEGLYVTCSNAAKIIQLNSWKIPDDYPCFK